MGKLKKMFLIIASFAAVFAFAIIGVNSVPTSVVNIGGVLNYSSNFIFTIIDSNTVSVRARVNTISGDIEIPAQVTISSHQYSVVTIEENGFKNCSSITDLKVPSTITSIGSSAFDGCSNMENVTIDSSYVYTNLTSKTALENLINNADTINLKTSADNGTNSFLNDNYIKSQTISGYNTYSFAYLITIPTGEGYELQNTNNTTFTTTKVRPGDSISFKVAIQTGYTQSTPVVKSNGNILTATSGVYTISNIQANQVLTVEGVQKNTYTLTFPSNVTVTRNGTPLVTGATITHFDTLIISYTETTGYHKTSFKVNGVEKTSGVSVTVTGDVTVTYAEEINKYTVTFAVNNASYGSVSRASQAEVPYGSTITVSGNTVTINGVSTTATPTVVTGYTTAFVDWTNATGTITDARTITANFSRTANTYTVQYNTWNGTAVATSSHTYDTAKNLTTYAALNSANANAFVVTGYTFAGWATTAHNTTKTGTVVHTDGKSVTNLTAVDGATVNLYATYTANEISLANQSYTLTYSTSSQTQVITGATNGTGSYTYAITAGNASSYFSISGTTITVAAGAQAGTYSLTVQATDDETAKTATATITITIINSAILILPTQDSPQNCIYNGGTKTPTWDANYDSNKMTIGGTTSSSSAGTHTATFTPKANYAWADTGTTEARNATWDVRLWIGDDVSAEYDGTVKTPTEDWWYYFNAAGTGIVDYDSSLITITGGTTSATNAGTYTIQITPHTGYKWRDGTSTAKSVPWEIRKALTFVPIPTSLTYNGSSQSPTWLNWDDSLSDISGTTSATNAGTYTATFTLKDPANYKWNSNGGGSDPKDVNWTIKVLSASIGFYPNTVSKVYGEPDFTKTVSNTGDGTVSYSSSNTSVATINSSTGVVHIVGAGSTTITATVTNTANCTYSTSTATYTLTVGSGTQIITLSETAIDVPYGTASTTFTATLTTGNGALSVSDNNATATVSISSGTVTVSNLGSLTAGTTITVTVTAAATTNYNQATADCTITIVKATLPIFEFELCDNNISIRDVGDIPEILLTEASGLQASFDGGTTWSTDTFSSINDTIAANLLFGLTSTTSDIRLRVIASDTTNYNQYGEVGILPITVVPVTFSASPSQVQKTNVDLTYGTYQNSVTLYRIPGTILKTYIYNNTLRIMQYNSAGNAGYGIASSESWDPSVYTCTGVNVTIGGSTTTYTIGSSFTISASATISAVFKNTVALPTDSSTTYTYNGSSQTYYPDNWASISSLVNISGNTRTNAGSQDVTFSLKDSSTYVWPDGTTTNKTLTFTIGKASLLIYIKPNDQTAVYTGSSVSVTNSYTVTPFPGDLKGSDTISVVTITGTAVYKYSSDSYSESTTAPTDVGTYNIRIYGLSATADNYSVTVSSGSATHGTLKIKSTGSINFNGSITNGGTLIEGYPCYVLYSDILSKTGDGVVTYTSSDTSVATVYRNAGVFYGLSIGGTGTTVITFSVADSDTWTYPTNSISFTLVVKPKLAAPTNVAVNANTGVITWNSVTGATGYQITFDLGDTWSSATSGTNYNSTITASTGTKYVIVRAITTDTTNYYSAEGETSGFSVNVYSLTLTSNTSGVNVTDGTTTASSITVNLIEECLIRWSGGSASNYTTSSSFAWFSYNSSDYSASYSLPQTLEGMAPNVYEIQGNSTITGTFTSLRVTFTNNYGSTVYVNGTAVSNGSSISVSKSSSVSVTYIYASGYSYRNPVGTIKIYTYYGYIIKINGSNYTSGYNHSNSSTNLSVTIPTSAITGNIVIVSDSYNQTVTS